MIEEVKWKGSPQHQQEISIEVVGVVWTGDRFL